jgi:hypothetical protein
VCSPWTASWATSCLMSRQSEVAAHHRGTATETLNDLFGMARSTGHGVRLCIQFNALDVGMAPNKTLQQTAATGIALPGLDVTAVAAAAELGRSALGVCCV